MPPQKTEALDDIDAATRTILQVFHNPKVKLDIYGDSTLPAISINVEPDILIVDEALSVGDMVFQAKCMARMNSMMQSGVTVLFVSHDTHSVKTLCQKALFLNKHGNF